MTDTKKVEKILPEELQYLDSLKKENTIYVLRSENTKLQYENALFKIMRKYNLSESDSIDESSGAIVRRAPVAPPAPQVPAPAPAQLPEPPPAPVPTPARDVVTEPEAVVTEKALKSKSKKHGS